MQSNLKQLKENFTVNFVNYENEETYLCKLILEKYEAFTSNKIKQFHPTNIQYIEQVHSNLHSVI